MVKGDLMQRRQPPHNSSYAPKKSPTKLAMKYSPGISFNNWTREEDLALKEGLAMFASFHGLKLYAKIAMKIGTKEIRDVALRVKWMNERGADLAIKSDSAAQTNILPHSSQESWIYNDDAIYMKAIGGTTGALVEQNKQALGLIEENLAAFGALNLMQLQNDNINLFRLIKDNVNKVLNDTNIGMPPLPISLSEMTDSLIHTSNNK